MNEKSLTYFMYTLIAMGLSLVLYGLYLVVFTDIVTKAGTDGILKVAMLIAGGLFILVPSKIFLTLQLLKNKKR